MAAFFLRAYGKSTDCFLTCLHMYKWLVLVLLLLRVTPSCSQASGLFDSDSVLHLVLSGDVRQLLRDRKDDPTYYPMSLIWREAEEWDTIKIRARTRGHFRRQSGACTYPPVLLNFSAEAVKGTLFDGQNKLKLVLPCQGEKYVEREFVAYKLYQVLTPRSFRVRRAEVQFLENDRLSKPIAGILLEDEHEMVARNDMVLRDDLVVRPEDTNPEYFLRMAMFQLMIGNTDWSVQYRQNIKLMWSKNSQDPIPVPYDFDHSGLVSAPYARPAAELELSSVRERRYRGTCQPDVKHFDPVIAEFQSKREAFFNVCRQAGYLDDTSGKFVLGYLEGFFKLLSNTNRLKEVLMYPCDPTGTGHVVITGLKP